MLRTLFYSGEWNNLTKELIHFKTSYVNKLNGDIFISRLIEIIVKFNETYLETRKRSFPVKRERDDFTVDNNCTTVAVRDRCGVMVT